jgi:tricorn protease-like protein
VALAISGALVLAACGSSAQKQTRRSIERNHAKPAFVLPGEEVLSPDARLLAFVKVVPVTDGAVAYLSVKPAGGGKARALYSSSDACCSNLTWASRQVLVFDDDYHVKTVNLNTGKVKFIAWFSDFSVSPNGRWIAGWSYSGGHSPRGIFVVSITGNDCGAVPRPPSADDSYPNFSSDNKRLFFQRQRFDPKLGHDVGSAHVVSIPVTQLRRQAKTPGGC